MSFVVEPIVIAGELLNVIHEETSKKIRNETKVEMPFLLRAWYVISEVIGFMKSSENHRIQLKMSLIKLACLNVNESNEIPEENCNTNSEVTHSSNVSLASNKNVMELLIAKTHENLPAVQKVRLLYPESDF